MAFCNYESQFVGAADMTWFIFIKLLYHLFFCVFEDPHLDLYQITIIVAISCLPHQGWRVIDVAEYANYCSNFFHKQRDFDSFIHYFEAASAKSSRCFFFLSSKLSQHRHSKLWENVIGTPAAPRSPFVNELHPIRKCPKKSQPPTTPGTATTRRKPSLNHVSLLYLYIFGAIN